MGNLEQGRLVWAELPDKTGQFLKDRPAVILTKTDEIVSGKQFVVAAVTSKFADPIPPYQVPLPWAPEGQCVTGLKMACVADSTWLVAITEDSIRRLGGVVPPGPMLAIMALVTKN